MLAKPVKSERRVELQARNEFFKISLLNISLGVKLSASYRMVRGVLKYRKILENQHFLSNFVLYGGARYSTVLASFGAKSVPVLATLLAHFISHTLIQARQRAFQML